MPQAAKEPTPEQMRVIKRRVRIRFFCTAVVCVLYGSFALGYGPLQALFIEKTPPASNITFGLVYFVFLVVLFLLIEFIYLKVANSGERDLQSSADTAEQGRSTTP